MKRKIFPCSVLLASVFLFSNITYSPTDTVRKRVAFSLAVGLVSGNDYGSAFKDYFSDYDISGYFGWVNLEVGAYIKAFRHFILYPNFKCLASRVQIITEGFEYAPSESMNAIFIPGIAAKYYVLEKRRSSIFISAGAGVSLCSTDFPDFDYKSNGIAKEGGIGYEYTERYKIRNGKPTRAGAMGFKIGYMSIPINLSTSRNSTQQKDFGGFSFSVHCVL